MVRQDQTAMKVSKHLFSIYVLFFSSYRVVKIFFADLSVDTILLRAQSYVMEEIWTEVMQIWGQAKSHAS